MTNLDDILRRIAYWNGYDTAGEWERTGHEVKAQLEQYIANQVQEARIKEAEYYLRNAAELSLKRTVGVNVIKDRIAALKGDDK